MSLYPHTKIEPYNTSIIKNFIDSEKKFKDGFIPINRPSKLRFHPLETHPIPTHLHPFQYANTSTTYRKGDFKKFIKPDLYDEEVKQPIAQYRDLYDVDGNIKVAPETIRKIYPEMKKIIQKRLM